MRYFSTFSGIGGFEYGIQQAFANKIKSKEQSEKRTVSELGTSTDITDSYGDRWWSSPTCVGYSEIDKYAIKVYEYQFGGKCENCRLARERERNSGTSGRQETLDGERTRLSQADRDNDNTKNERSKDNNGCTCPKNYGDITKINANELPDFDCLVGGFPCQAFSIAGKRGGFEDTRGTLFFDLARILRAKQPRLFVFENVKGLLSHDNGNTFRTIIATIDELGYDCQWQVLNSKNHGVPQNRERIIIVGHLRGTSRPEVFPITRTNSKDIEQLNTPKHSNDRVYGTDGISPTLNTMQGGNRQPFISQKPQIRRLTPVECERLQGFPDNWTALGVNDEPISDTQRYKMCGNAVTTNVIQAVFERILV